MTRDEYIKLVESSDSYKSATPDLQKKIHAAEGEEMKTYAKIFLEERERLMKEQENLAAKTRDAVRTFGENAGKLKKKYLSAMEGGAKKEEEKNVEELFKAIK